MSGTNQNPSPLWLFPHRMNYMNSITNRSGTNGDVKIFAFYTPVSITITRFNLLLATLGGAGTHCRLGLYNSASQTAPTPDGGSLLWDSGDLVADATAQKDIALTSGTPAANVTISGWFFGCIETNDATVQYVGSTGNNLLTNQGSEKITGCFYNQTYGALNATCPATTLAAGANANCALRYTFP